jgi:hypothetical protein
LGGEMAIVREFGLCARIAQVVLGGDSDAAPVRNLGLDVEQGAPYRTSEQHIEEGTLEVAHDWPLSRMVRG